MSPILCHAHVTPDPVVVGRRVCGGAEPSPGSGGRDLTGGPAPWHNAGGGTSYNQARPPHRHAWSLEYRDQNLVWLMPTLPLVPLVAWMVWLAMTKRQNVGVALAWLEDKMLVRHWFGSAQPRFGSGSVSIRLGLGLDSTRARPRFMAPLNRSGLRTRNTEFRSALFGLGSARLLVQYWLSSGSARD